MAKTSSSSSVVYLTNTTAPYRERMHELLAEQYDSYSVVYCTKLEPDRLWELEFGNYDKHFLTEKSTDFRHNNPEVWKLLNKLNPDALIITAFKPTMIYGALWCVMKRKKLIVYNDGTFKSEENFSFVQKLIRKMIFSKTKAFVATGKGGFDLYKSYHVDVSKMFKSCLCVDNTRFYAKPVEDREYHILFCGQIIERKMPMFFVEIAKKLNKLIPNFKVLIIGEGDLRQQMLEELDKENIQYEFTGYLTQKALPTYYTKAKIFLFPTLNDPWGVVVNESCAAGTPVFTCDNAGVADDLIIHGENGYVLPLDVDTWVSHSLQLLTDYEKLETFSDNAVNMVQCFNHHKATEGIVKSVTFALAKHKRAPLRALETF